jgi:hypothetical protein
MRSAAMTRRLWLIPCALLAAAACSKKADTGTDTAATPGTTTTAEALSVTGVDLGRTIDANSRVTYKTDDFKPNDTIYASVATTGTSPNATLSARWTYQDGQVVDTTSRAIAPAGAAATEFHISKPSGFPKGNYKVEIMLNGASVQSKDFKVE